MTLVCRRGIGSSGLRNAAAGGPRQGWEGCSGHLRGGGGGTRSHDYLCRTRSVGQSFQTGGLQAFVGEQTGVVGPIHCLRHLALVKETARTHLDVEFSSEPCLSLRWPPVSLH